MCLIIEKKKHFLSNHGKKTLTAKSAVQHSHCFLSWSKAPHSHSHSNATSGILFASIKLVNTTTFPRISREIPSKTPKPVLVGRCCVDYLITVSGSTRDFGCRCIFPAFSFLRAIAPNTCNMFPAVPTLKSSAFGNRTDEKTLHTRKKYFLRVAVHQFRVYCSFGIKSRLPPYSVPVFQLFYENRWLYPTIFFLLKMAGAQFEYDEKGTTFYYFLISFFGIVLAPVTYYVWKITKLPGKQRIVLLASARQL